MAHMSEPVDKSTPSKEDRFRVLQKWQGRVIEVGDKSFLAHLVTFCGEGPDQEAEIFFEVAKYDHGLIEPGAMFYWSIGDLIRPTGTLT